MVVKATTWCKELCAGQVVCHDQARDDGRTDGPTEGRTSTKGRTKGRTKGPTDRRTDRTALPAGPPERDPRVAARGRPCQLAQGTPRRGRRPEPAAHDAADRRLDG